ncbi:MAG TPA: hypothetical protein VFF57_07605 [Hanamia sp.]|nr:hypothetical protein [Hanamia sp.]
MKKEIQFFLCFFAITCMAVTCKKQTAGNTTTIPTKDSSLVNTAHLDYLTVPVTFPDGVSAGGVYVYANAPDYHLTPAEGEGYTCVDDVSRAALVYLRKSNFSTDSSVQSKALKLINFLLEMQSANGYFYNFLLNGTQINTNGNTSINNPEWWSWRALQTLTEGWSLVKSINPTLAAKMNNAVGKLVSAIKTDLVNLPKTTKVVNGITVPEWLPAGSGTDQAALLIVGLISYCSMTNDAVIKSYIQQLADGIILMQPGDSNHFPYNAFLSWENTWHAYGNTQAYALFKAGEFLNDSKYTLAAFSEVDNFYPWLLQNGFKASFDVVNNGGILQETNEKQYDQIAYGISPMVLAATEAYRLTSNEKYADMAGHIGAWFFGANDAGQNMYSKETGLCFDGLTSSSKVNMNSGAESTIEALLALERIEAFPAIVTELNKYKK